MPKDPLHTALCDMLEVEYPVISFNHCLDVAVAVANSGGAAVLGAAGKTPEEIDEAIRWIKARTSRPFGIDLLLPASAPPGGSQDEMKTSIPQEHIDWVNKLKHEFGIPEPKVPPRRSPGTVEYARQQMEPILDHRVPFFACGLGSPSWVVQGCHDRGMKVLSLVGNVRQARRVRDAGSDIVVAQDHDAGGHTGRIGTFTLVPQVVDAVSPTPVIAAGGIGDGRGLAAALCLGAVGVWTGTIWLATHEHDLDIVIKQKMLEATEEDTRVTKIYSGKTQRRLYNAWLAAWERPDAPAALPMPLQGMLVSDAMAAIDEAKVASCMSTPAGQIVGMIKELKPARMVLLEMVERAQQLMEEMAPTLAGG